MAKTKGKGTTQLGRDSEAKRLGVKHFAGEWVKPGYILVRQRGTKIFPGRNVARGGDDTLFAVQAGKVEFRTKRRVRFDGSRREAKEVNVIPE